MIVGYAEPIGKNDHLVDVCSSLLQIEANSVKSENKRWRALKQACGYCERMASSISTIDQRPR